MTDKSNDMTDNEKMEFVFHIRESDVDIENWDREVATALALEEGISLTDAHWEVISYLRRFTEGSGSIDYARDLSAILDTRFKDKGGLRYLFRLFPKGPVSQGCKIAGIPVPSDSKQPAFGSIA